MKKGIPRGVPESVLLRLGMALVLVVALCLGPLLVAAQVSTVLTVTNTSGSGPGSLRYAIDNADSGSVIDFAPGLAGHTITLASQLTLSKDVTIDGSALATPVTISGNSAVRVFDVNSGVIAGLNGLRIIGGRADYGGGIRNDGTLTVTNCTIEGNTAFDF